jgi:DNA-binding PadR family transcriptional regulator
MVLGTLARHGPRHGHEIRRLAELTNVSEWGGVSVGALYRELRTMETEGLVEPVRTEQVGRRPARTVYEITDEGRLELAMLRERAVRGTHWGPDPLGVALTFSGAGVDRDELLSWMRGRREMFAIAASQIEAERQRLVTRGYLGPVEAAVMYRGQLHAETEVRWHDEFAKILAELPPGTGFADQAWGPRPGSGGPGTGEPDGGEPDGGEPDESQPAAGQPDESQPDEGQPDEGGHDGDQTTRGTGGTA